MTTPADLDDRYGRRADPRRRRAVWIAAVAAAAAVVGWFGWHTVANPDNGVRADGTSFHLEERAVTVDFQLTAPLRSRVACAIEALDEDYGVVGFKVVEYPASDSPVRAYSERVPTLAAATTGLVNSCWVT
ncbi:MAG: DUF4307 domain-containing protein [Microbacterium sp.]|uniref:DUF4307 domain-containing protein n=1 Tax=Microbacterium sp. TaxID=51671 RepID=UPI0039E330DC